VAVGSGTSASVEDVNGQLGMHVEETPGRSGTPSTTTSNVLETGTYPYSYQFCYSITSKNRRLVTLFLIV
jgi:hypothetical protein